MGILGNLFKEDYIVGIKLLCIFFCFYLGFDCVFEIIEVFIKLELLCLVLFLFFFLLYAEKFFRYLVYLFFFGKFCDLLLCFDGERYLYGDEEIEFFIMEFIDRNILVEENEMDRRKKLEFWNISVDFLVGFFGGGEDDFYNKYMIKILVERDFIIVEFLLWVLSS